MSTKRLIGFSGKSGSGKNFAASIIDKHFQSVSMMSFADPLKLTCMELFNLTLDDCFTEVGKKRVTAWRWDSLVPEIAQDRTGFMTVRQVLQTVGTELIRNKWNNHHWTELFINKYRKSSAEIVLVTDVRFLNEADTIRSLGGIIVNIHGRINKDTPAQHASEQQLLGHDYSIYNHEQMSEHDLKIKLSDVLQQQWGITL